MTRDSQLVFLFPSDYFHPKQPDEAFVDQAQALKQLGFRTAVLSLESAIIFPALQATDVVVYRGWMFTAEQYQQMTKIIEKFGARPLNRAIQKYLEDPVAEEILKGEIPEGGTILADYEGTGEVLTIKAKKPKAPSKEKKSE